MPGDVSLMGAPALDRPRRGESRGLCWLGLLVVTFWGGVGAPVWGAADDGNLEPNYLFPAGGQRGTDVSVKARGDLPRWPLQVWSATAGITWQPTDEKGTWLVRLDGTVPCGVHWVRLYDQRAASSLLPFYVDNVPHGVAQEPDNRLREIKPVSLPMVIDGQLQEAEDVDGFQVHVEAGQTLVVQMMAQRLGSPIDGIVQIALPNGIVVAQLDDERGLDPLLAWPCTVTNDYIVRVFGFPSKPDSSIRFTGGPDVRYRLAMTTGPFLDYTMPLAAPWSQAAVFSARGWNLPPETPALASRCDLLTDRFNVSLDQGMGWLRVPSYAARMTTEVERELTLPCYVSGTIAGSQEADRYEFVGKTGENIVVELWSDRLGASLDGQLTMDAVLAEGDTTSPAWTQSVDDAQQKDPQLTVSLPRDSRYRITVRDLYGQGGPRHYYGLLIRHGLPDYRLTVDRDHWFLTTNGQAELVVAVDRQGFTEPIYVTCDRLPKGVTVEPAWSVVGTDTEKSVKLIVRGGPQVGAYAGPCRVIARSEGGREAVATWLAPFILEPIPSGWLTVAPQE